MRYLQKHFSYQASDSLPESKRNNHMPVTYVRVDGVMREDGSFVLMGNGAIECDFWLEAVVTLGCREELWAALLGKEVPDLSHLDPLIHNSAI